MKILNSTIFFIAFICYSATEIKSQTIENFQPEPNTKAKSMLTTFEGWEAYPILTVGDSIGNYIPPGVFDGIGVMPIAGGLKIFVNHEFDHNKGFVYNSILKGARISTFDLDLKSLKLSNGSVAYSNIIDRNNQLISSPSQIYDATREGFKNFCSGGLHKAGTYNLSDDIYIAGEEWDNGQVTVLDIKTKTLYVAPALGWGAWENVAFVETGHKDKVAVLLSDDRNDAPMYLYVGTKNAKGDFLDRNGLKNGKLHVWVAQDGSRNYDDFNGNNTNKVGEFIEIPFKGKDLVKYDGLGFLKDRKSQINEAELKKYFKFNRPEDIHTNPKNTKEVVFSTTGVEESKNKFGAIFTMELNFKDLNNIKAVAKIIYDCNLTGENGIRNPDNLVWSEDGNIYVNEDPSTAEFIEPNSPTIYKLNTSGIAIKIAKIVKEIPKDQKYNGSYWETSGVLDISKYFNSGTYLLVNVQAHGVTGGLIDELNLVEGAQMLVLRKP